LPLAGALLCLLRPLPTNAIMDSSIKKASEKLNIPEKIFAAFCRPEIAGRK
jgi:hypothetical protein